jgi:hypothetical protein
MTSILLQAGSGEFHVYKQNRRREYERLKLMDEKAKEVGALLQPSQLSISWLAFNFDRKRKLAHSPNDSDSDKKPRTPKQPRIVQNVKSARAKGAAVQQRRTARTGTMLRTRNASSVVELERLPSSGQTRRIATVRRKTLDRPFQSRKNRRNSLQPPSQRRQIIWS